MLPCNIVKRPWTASTQPKRLALDGTKFATIFASLDVRHPGVGNLDVIFQQPL
jgi:hypothetical protein